MSPLFKKLDPRNSSHASATFKLLTEKEAPHLPGQAPKIRTLDERGSPEVAKEAEKRDQEVQSYEREMLSWLQHYFERRGNRGGVTAAFVYYCEELFKGEGADEGGTRVLHFWYSESAKPFKPVARFEQAQVTRSDGASTQGEIINIDSLASFDINLERLESDNTLQKHSDPFEVQKSYVWRFRRSHGSGAENHTQTTLVHIARATVKEDPSPLIPLLGVTERVGKAAEEWVERHFEGFGGMLRYQTKFEVKNSIPKAYFEVGSLRHLHAYSEDQV